mmetsp:Transcript_37489/g.86478  ORF Transcript_37489/g.86478 Transcript_37489/m.86478 type:complete len:517 (+) Transcript_37489:104-1654(+)
MFCGCRCWLLATHIALAYAIHTEDVSSAPGRGRLEASDAEGSLDEFDAYVQMYSRPYKRGSEEYQMRQALYKQRKAEIEAHNSRDSRLWTAGVNHFTDQTEGERARVRGWKHVHAPETAGGIASLLEGSDAHVDAAVNISTLPEAVHWMHLNASLRHQDQGGCGSCWAVAAASVLDAHYEIYHGKSTTFSPQELVSCVPNPKACGGTGGCDGATVELAMAYVKGHGLQSESVVPYEASDTPCQSARSTSNALLDKTNQGSVTMTIASWQMLHRNTDAPLAKALFEHGPVGVSLSASNLHDYAGGIFDKCDKDCVVDHATTLYGYGKETGKQYWLIKNSWGRSWGEQGFFRLLRQTGSSLQCGIDRSPGEGTGCRGGPSQVKVCGMCGILYDSVVPFVTAGGAAQVKTVKPDTTTVPWSMSADSSLVEDDENSDPDTSRWQLDSELEDSEPSLSEEHHEVVDTPADALGEDGLEDASDADYAAVIAGDHRAADTEIEVSASGQPLIRRRAAQPADAS